MLGVYASAAAILLASLVIGRAGLTLLGLTARTWLSGAVGFAALTIACPVLIRLPGRAAGAAIFLGVVLIASIAYLWRKGQRSRAGLVVGTTVALLVVVAASLPFFFNERNGVLGEGIY